MPQIPTENSPPSVSMDLVEKRQWCFLSLGLLGGFLKASNQGSVESSPRVFWSHPCDVVMPRYSLDVGYNLLDSLRRVCNSFFAETSPIHRYYFPISTFCAVFSVVALSQKNCCLRKLSNENRSSTRTYYCIVVLDKTIKNCNKNTIRRSRMVLLNAQHSSLPYFPTHGLRPFVGK